MFMVVMMKAIALSSIAFNGINIVFFLTLSSSSYGFVLPSCSNHRSSLMDHDRRTLPNSINSRRRRPLLLPLAKFDYGDFLSINNNKSDNGDNDDDDPSWEPSESEEPEEDEVAMPPICRIVARADSCLPSSRSVLPRSLMRKPFLLQKLDAYFHAKGRQETNDLKYLRRSSASVSDEAEGGEEEIVEDGDSNQQATTDAASEDEEEEMKLVSVARSSLENAGFQLLSKRDLDLCDSLNAAYLLRLSIRPDVSKLAPIAREFYPERFNTTTGESIGENEPLFDGRVLVYWRSYSKEISKGRLILPKLDYLQANLVQRFAAMVSRFFGRYERRLNQKISAQKNQIKKSVKDSFKKGTESIRNSQLAQLVKGVDLENSLLLQDEDIDNDNLEGSIKLQRYGGTKASFFGSPDPNDALDPFLMCEVKYYKPSNLPNNLQYNGTNLIDSSVKVTAADAESDMNDVLNHQQGFICEYDSKGKTSATSNDQPPSRMQLLERVSISNLVDIFSRSGRKKFIKALFAQSELVEPTYEEVVVLWRPLKKKKERTVYRPPKLVSELADMFDVPGFEQPPKEKLVPPKEKLQIRTFQRVPMANLAAVHPKTKLVFKAADAFLFDLISIATFFVVASSIRLDNPRLDVLAIISVTLWTIRTVIRYSNKLARYDLLVKNFLTSKISHRNEGALKYLISEAGSQRAIRASLVHHWLSKLPKMNVARQDLERDCIDGVNEMLKIEREVQVDVGKALDDLDALDIVTFSKEEEGEEGEVVVNARGPRRSSLAIKEAWAGLLKFDGEYDDFKGQTIINPSNMSRLYF